MEKKSDVIVFGFVGHLPKDRIIEFEHLLQSLPYLRIVRREISDDKLWIIKSKLGGEL